VNDNSHSKNLDLAVQISRTFSQVSHKLRIIIPGPVIANFQEGVIQPKEASGCYQDELDNAGRGSA
jgi:hypothetical protein